MDIEALVNRITAEVLKEVGRMQLDDGRASDRMPPPSSNAVEKSQVVAARPDEKACLCLVNGSCGEGGCCAERMPGCVRNFIKEGAERISNPLGARVSASDIAPRIDHTLLKPDATADEIRKLCSEARQHQFASVCINPGYVALAAELLRGSTVKVCTVVGFPLGATTTFSKVSETKDAVANGAGEIDMVINIGALKNGEDHSVEDDMHEVVLAASGRITKAILETALLSDDEVVRACRMAKRAGLDFVKTSTGFGPGGATVHHVALMRKTVGLSMGVKASGGVRDLEGARAMIEAGATRIGASASVKIVHGEQGAEGY